MKTMEHVRDINELVLGRYVIMLHPLNSQMVFLSRRRLVWRRRRLFLKGARMCLAFLNLAASRKAGSSGLL